MICPNVLWHATLWMTAAAALASVVVNIMRACRSRTKGTTLWRLASTQTLIAAYVLVIFVMLGCGIMPANFNDVRILFRTGVLLLVVGQLIEAVVDL